MRVLQHETTFNFWWHHQFLFSYWIITIGAKLTAGKPLNGKKTKHTNIVSSWSTSRLISTSHYWNQMHYEACFTLNLLLLINWIKPGSNRKLSRKHPAVALLLTKHASVYASWQCSVSGHLNWLMLGLTAIKSSVQVFINLINNFSLQLTSAFPLFQLNNASGGKLPA